MSDSPGRGASQADFRFEVGSLTVDDLKVVGFSGSEGLSELYCFRISFCSTLADIDFATIIGKPCWLEIACSGGERYVNGMVRRFERVGHGSKLTYWLVEVVPVFWLLTKRIRSRIFQEHNCSDMTAPGIIKRVFELAGIQDSAYRLALSGTYPAREYTVQYRESDWDFVSRLMEEEGIYYFFEHTAEGHKLVLGDGTAAHVASPLAGNCLFREPTGLVPESEHVFALSEAGEIQIGATRLKDFDFTHPPLVVMGNKAGDQYTALEAYDYPGRVLTREEATRLATVRFEEQQCAGRTLTMSATVGGLMPGEKFTLAEHPVEALNREYLVTRIVHEARQPQSLEGEASGDDGARYTATARLIPSDVVFRAPRITARPIVRGTQTAFVVGPSGEEIYTDKYGRVKIQFHWDLEGGYDENSSCWVRVSQGMAGGQYGILFLPRVGQEVVVDFLEGDPDRPIITGRVFNNDQMPPYTLPDHKTRSVIKTNSSTGGGGTNELMFEDLKDSEKILLYAQKDLHLRVKNDRVENVEHDRFLTVANDRKTKITNEDHLKVEAKRFEEVVGDVSIKTGGKKSEQVVGTNSLTCDDDVVESFKKNYKCEVTSTTEHKADSIKLEGSTAIELKVGGSSIIISSSSIAIASGGASVTLSSGNVYIVGTAVNINSGSGSAGDSVAAVSASATSPEAPAAPTDADTATPGADVTYSASPEQPAALEVEFKVATPPEPVEATPVETTWIEIELVDEADQPVAGEPYEVTISNGKIRKGTLDANGVARIEGIPAGDCQICFPRLDSAAWEPIT